MAVQFVDESAVLTSVVPIEEAEDLARWLASHPSGQLDLGGCEHLHTAVVQVILCSRAPISRPPPDALLARLLTAFAAPPPEARDVSAEREAR